MNLRYLTGQATEPPAQPVALPVPLRLRHTDPAGYLMDPALADAVNVALLLSQPLLLTGDPGTGKTQLAHRIAWELGYGDALVFNTKSSSTARDLFYSFDTMGRFQAAHTGAGSAENLDYLEWSALGLAILRSRPASEVKHLLRKDATHDGPRRSVVLVDEIDKAPRDFPNDLLHEVDHLSFRVPELKNVLVAADPALRPVLVLTSNSEKNLPDAFLRRCIFFNIPAPGPERLAQIVAARLEPFADAKGAFLQSALAFFGDLRTQLRRPPATAELINWLQAMAYHGAEPGRALRDQPDVLRETLGTLAKSRDDAEDLDRFVKAYLGG